MKNKIVLIFLLSLGLINIKAAGQCTSPSDDCHPVNIHLPNPACTGGFPINTDAGTSMQCQSYTWTNLSGTVIASGTSMPSSAYFSVASTYTLTTSWLGPEIVQNGNFNEGTSCFSTDYGPETPGSLTSPTEEGVTAHPSSYGGIWPDPPLPAGSANMLAVDGHTTAGKTVWKETLDVCPNQTYKFSFMVATLLSPAAASIQVKIPSSVSPTTLTGFGSTPGAWNSYSFTWTSGPAQTSATITITDLNITPGGNDFAIDNISFRRSANTSQVVTVGPAAGPIASSSGSLVLCGSGTTATLTDPVAGGTWSSSNSHVSITTGGLITGVSTGMSTISYTMPGGCFVTQTVNVTPSLSPTISAPSVSICQHDIIPLTVNPDGGTSYSWSFSFPPLVVSAETLTSAMLQGATAGVGTVTYTAIAGTCSGTTTLTITVNALPPALYPETICTGSNYEYFEGGPSIGGWYISNTAVATKADGSGGGEYIYGAAPGTATIYFQVSASGCMAQTTINVLPTLTPTVTPTPIHLCIGDPPLSLTADPDGGTSATWSTSSGCAALSGYSISGGTLTASSAGTTTILYTATSAGACPGTATVNAIVDAPPLPITGPTTLCLGSTISLSDPSGGGGWYSTVPANAPIDMSSGVVTGVMAGTSLIYYYNLSTQCHATTTVTVEPKPNIGIMPVPSNICVGDVIPITGIPGVGVSATWSVVGSAVTLSAPGLSGVTLTAVGTGVATIVYSVAGPGGCPPVTTSITVTVNASPAPIGGSPYICGTGTTYLTDATVGGTWSSSNSAIVAIDWTGWTTGLDYGSAIISYALPDGCSALKTVYVTPEPTPSVVGNVSSSICVNGSFHVDVNPGTTYAYTPLWTSAPPGIVSITGTGTSALITGSVPGSAVITYSVTTIPYGCTGSTSFGVVVNPLPVVLPITGMPTACAGSTLTLSDATPGGVWSSSATSIVPIDPTGEIDLPGTDPGGSAVISYTVIDGNGCKNAATYNVTVDATGSACVWPDPSMTFDGIDITSITGSVAYVTFQCYYVYGGSLSSPDTYIYTIPTSGTPMITTTGTYPTTSSPTPVPMPSHTAAICLVNAYSSNGCPWPLNCCTKFHNPVPRHANTTGTVMVNNDEDIIAIVPNPNKGEFTIQGLLTGITDAKELSFEIVNMLGQVVYKDVATIENGAINKNIALGENVANGLYLVKIKDDYINQVIRFTLDR